MTDTMTSKNIDLSSETPCILYIHTYTYTHTYIYIYMIIHEDSRAVYMPLSVRKLWLLHIQYLLHLFIQYSSVDMTELHLLDVNISWMNEIIFVRTFVPFRVNTLLCWHCQRFIFVQRENMSMIRLGACRGHSHLWKFPVQQDSTYPEAGYPHRQLSGSTWPFWLTFSDN